MTRYSGRPKEEVSFDNLSLQRFLFATGAGGRHPAGGRPGIVVRVPKKWVIDMNLEPGQFVLVSRRDRTISFTPVDSKDLLSLLKLTEEE